MNRAQLEHVLLAASQAVGVHDLLVLGSQAVLGTYPAWQLPPEATASAEVDLAVDLALARLEAEIDETEFADRIEAALGKGSAFEHRHGYFADGVEPATAALTDGWRERLVPVVAESPLGTAVGWCLEVNDLWVAKAAAARRQDYQFCTALAREGLVSEQVCAERIAKLPPGQRSRAEQVYIRSFRKAAGR